MDLPLHDPLVGTRHACAHDEEAGSERLGDSADHLDDARRPRP
ncbi:hypothetical protein [Actinoplanes ianthinogenes]|nr:hypothetical protein [Actinoplanes ianthinogenes]